MVSFLVGLNATLLGSGIQPRLMPASRFVVSFIAALELIGFMTLIAVLVPVMAPRQGVTCVLASVISSASLWLHYRACHAHPGYLATEVSQEAPLPMPRFNMGTCATCRVVRPLRSKHCGYCGRCVESADHHCPVVNTCVGRGNLHAFLAYIITLFVAQALFLRLTVAWCRVVVSAPEASGSDALWQATSSHPGMVLQALIQILLVLGNGLLIGRALICILSNLTTNEMLRWPQLGYLLDDSGGFFNPFDQGPSQNCLQFWSGAEKADWSTILEDRLQGGKEAAVATVPKVSMTSAIRWLATLRTQLKQSSEARKLQQEDKILIRRGGVDPRVATSSHAAANLAVAKTCNSCRYGN